MVPTRNIGATFSLQMNEGLDHYVASCIPAFVVPSSASMGEWPRNMSLWRMPSYHIGEKRAGTSHARLVLYSRPVANIVSSKGRYSVNSCISRSGIEAQADVAVTKQPLPNFTICWSRGGSPGLRSLKSSSFERLLINA